MEVSDDLILILAALSMILIVFGVLSFASKGNLNALIRISPVIATIGVAFLFMAVASAANTQNGIKKQNIQVVHLQKTIL